ncbi:hypothetical protein AAFF_G00293030 [Aldrovandia affinis]|uniref:Uncharacterized protein n=1 Tax=Aldrovandia affinis TaxID=143900 RepID=A0AAD7SQL3_9TELE|nr:hypothetical protein AAFF_G00293030 [Aldrovandia affinis]
MAPRSPPHSMWGSEVIEKLNCIWRFPSQSKSQACSMGICTGAEACIVPVSKSVIVLEPVTKVFIFPWKRICPQGGKSRQWGGLVFRKAGCAAAHCTCQKASPRAQHRG